jgi:hypothetical protein
MVKSFMADEEREDENSFYGIEAESSAEMTLEGKYRCRQCGKIFDTMEEHEAHHRIVHESFEFEPILGMAM